MTTVGLLHTADSNAAVFDEALDAAAPGMDRRHVVDESLLADARTIGLDDEGLRARVVDGLRRAADGADAVLCTCSTLGPLAEAAGAAVGVPVVRVDRAMADAAVRRGRVVAVVAAVQSTLVPTAELLQDAADAAGRSVELRLVPCTEAWAYFEAGDLAGYAEAVAAVARGLDGTADVIVLAQASMAPAAARCDGMATPVVTSPGPAVDALLAAAGRA